MGTELCSTGIVIRRPVIRATAPIRLEAKKGDMTCIMLPPAGMIIVPGGFSRR
jgi:hypothetical protein